MTSSLTLTTCTVELAQLGPDSPLPSVQPLLESAYIVGEGLPADIVENARWGKVANIYPYPLQEEYSRETSARGLAAVVLENALVKATFLPELGGRLWSLVDKASGKELLHTQDRIQFANLALRNAWFAGGIEFNIGTRGHSPTTCAPLHTAKVRTPEGQEVLRMWEFDRLRGVVFQIDAWLPEDSRAVFTAVRLRNPNPVDVAMYWWTNAAVPQTPATRVLAPARHAYATDYDGSMTRVDPTNVRGVDASWPANNAQAADFFFDIAPQERRWELAVDDAGDGLALLSSPQLRGRKLFVWGESVGGHRWQEWLSPSCGGEARHYAEIQSGLAQTQFEHVRMPAGASWQWVEAYGNAALDPALAAGPWEEAVAHGAQRVEELVSAQAMERALADAARWADLPPSEMLLAGNGWGALEARRRHRSGAGWINEAGTPFGAGTLTAAQEPWLELLDGAGPEAFAGAESFVAGPDWEDLLAGHAAASAEAAFHLAVMVHARTPAADLPAVAALYQELLDRPAGEGVPLSGRSRALAHRGLAWALLASGHVAQGLEHAAAACALGRGCRALLVEAATLAADHGNPRLVLDLVDKAPAELRELGRIQFLVARAQADLGAPAVAAAILKSGIEVPDIREGANSLTELWLRVCPGEDVPAHYQFSMD